MATSIRSIHSSEEFKSYCNSIEELKTKTCQFFKIAQQVFQKSFAPENLERAEKMQKRNYVALSKSDLVSYAEMHSNIAKLNEKKLINPSLYNRYSMLKNCVKIEKKKGEEKFHFSFESEIDWLSRQYQIFFSDLMQNFLCSIAFLDREKTSFLHSNEVQVPPVSSEIEPFKFKARSGQFFFERLFVFSLDLDASRSDKIEIFQNLIDKLLDEHIFLSYSIKKNIDEFINDCCLVNSESKLRSLMDGLGSIKENEYLLLTRKDFETIWLFSKEIMRLMLGTSYVKFESFLLGIISTFKIPKEIFYNTVYELNSLAEQDPESLVFRRRLIQLLCELLTIT